MSKFRWDKKDKEQIRNSLILGLVFLIGFLYYAYLYSNDKAYIVVMVPTGFLSIFGFVNFIRILIQNIKSNSIQCKPLDKVFNQKLSNEMKMYFGPFLCEDCLDEVTSKNIPTIHSIQLFGCDLIGSAKKCKVCGSSIQTIWFRFLIFPLIPLGSYRVKHGIDFKQEYPSDPSILMTNSHSIFGKRIKTFFFLRHLVIVYCIYLIIILILFKINFL